MRSAKPLEEISKDKCVIVVAAMMRRKKMKNKTDKKNYIRINGVWVEWEDSVEDLLKFIELSPDPIVAAFNIEKEKLEGD